MLAYGFWVYQLPEDEGGGWLAEIPQLPGCMSDGETPDEAMTNAYRAAEEWLEEARRLGREIPEPQHDIKVQVA